MTKEFTKRTTSPFRYDIVGSYLRPERLKTARKAFEAKEISQADLTKVEDEEIIALIKKQEELGLKAVTDGEFRRSWWHLDFFWGLQGIDFKEPKHGYQFHGEETRKGTVTVTGKVSGNNHPFLQEYRFVRKHAAPTTEVKQTLPAPAQSLAELLRPDNIGDVFKFYDSVEKLIDDLVIAYRQVVQDFYDEGARTLQFDDCTWGIFVNDLPDDFVADTGKDEATVRAELKALYLDINNRVLENWPADLTLNTHVCRGNYHSTWATSGGYDEVADPLFNHEKVNAYYLEYDTNRSGGFEPLALVSEGKYVVLGLVTSKDGELESPEKLIARIEEAAKFVPLDYLCLSTQCGFASTEEGNILTEEAQWEKIKLVKSVAETVWGKD